MNMFIKNTKHLHFIGIGGIGMSGMAELLYNHGFTISGSDLKISHRTKHLESYKKINIYYSHKSKNINNTSKIAKLAKSYKISLEGEVGIVGYHNGKISEGTNLIDAKKFANENPNDLLNIYDNIPKEEQQDFINAVNFTDVRLP